MQYTALIIAVIALIVGLFGAMSGASQQSITLNEGERDRTITLTGEAERFVAPDVAEVSFSLQHKAPKAQDALNSVNSRMAGLVDALTSMGIKESDIKTVNYNVDPQYRYVQEKFTDPEGTIVSEGGNRVFDGYQVRQGIRVIIRDLDNVEKVMTQIGALKADNLSGLTFRVDDDAQIREELRAEAIAEAKDKAEKLGADLGVRLTHIVGFSEGGGFNPSPYAARSYGLEDAAAVEEAVIPVGENQLSARVNVTFMIE